MSRRNGLLRAFSLAIAISAAPSLAGCPARMAHVAATRTVVAAGSLTEQLAVANDQGYTAATDAIRARLVASHGTVEQYVAATAGIDAEHARRARALGGLSDTLYAAAGLIDGARDGGLTADYVLAAGRVLAGLDTALSALGGHELPALPIPAQVETIRSALRTIVGTGTPR